MDIKKILEYTNARLKQRYINVKKDYDIDWSATALYSAKDNSITIEYIENWIAKTYEVEYFEDEAIDYVFNVRAENI
jgi:hypothetical protein